MELTPENQQKINDVLGYLLDSVQKVGDVAVDQLPLVAREIAAWGFWSNLFSALLPCVMLWPLAALGLWQFFRAFGDTHECNVYGEQATVCGLSDHHPRFGRYLLCTIVGVALLMISLIVGGTTQAPSAVRCIKAAVAPRVYVIDWLRDKN